MSAADRDAHFLGDVRIAVIGDSAASDSVIAVLSALGAAPLRVPASAADLPPADVVIVDRIAAGIDAAYLASVDADLHASRGTARAWVTISTFGMDGPYAAYRGSELVAAAAGCLLAAVSDERGALHLPPAHQALQIVGQAAALAALHALSRSRAQAAPVHLDVSAQEAIAFASVQQELAHLLYDCAGQGGTPRYAALHRVVPCADGMFNLVVVDDHQFARVCDAVGRTDWLETYPTVAERNEHADEINGWIARWAAERSKDECEEILQAHAVPATAFRTIDEATRSEQFTARGWDHRPASTTPTTGVLPALLRRIPDEPQEPGSTTRARRAEAPNLGDLHLVEVTDVLAGPLAGAIIAAMGATVVRLEDRERLDTYRRNGPFAEGVPGTERAAYYQAANYNKLSVADALTEDPTLAGDLLAWSDVVLENVGERRLARLGIEVADLHRDGSGCSLSISGFGRSGPHSHFRAYAWNVHSYAGLAEAVTASAGPGVVLRTPLADYCAAMWAATVLAAWWLGGDGEALKADLSMAEVVASKLVPFADRIGDDADHGAPASAPESAHDVIAPLRDGLTLAVTVTDFAALFAALGIAAPAGDDPVPGAIEALGQAAGEKPEQVVDLLQRSGIAAYLVRTPTTLLGDDQVRAREFLPEVGHPELGHGRIIALPWKEAARPREWYRRAPMFGESDAQIRTVLAGRTT